MFNILKSNEDKSKNIIADKDILIIMIGITYTPPLNRFNNLHISRAYPYKNYFSITDKRL